MSTFQSIETVLVGKSDNRDQDQSIVFYEEGIRSAREIGELYNITRWNRETMRSAPFWGSWEWTETKEDRAETVTASDSRIAGATDNPTQRKIPCLGNPKNQAPIKPSLFLENCSSHPQEAWTAHPNQTQITTYRQTVPASTGWQHVAMRYLSVPNPGCRQGLRQRIYRWLFSLPREK